VQLRVRSDNAVRARLGARPLSSRNNRKMVQMASITALISLLLVPSAALVTRGDQSSLEVRHNTSLPVHAWAHKYAVGHCGQKVYRFSPVGAKSLAQLPGAGVDLKDIVPYRTVLKDGFLPLDCITDEMYYHGDKHDDNRHDYTMKSSDVSIVHYSVMVPKEDQKPMTPEECFDFCRTVPKMLYFGILNGRQCYCTPWFKRMAGSSESCASVCEGDPTQICGGKSKSAMFEMHMCNDLAGDLKDGIAKLDKELETMTKKAESLELMAKQAQKESDEFRELFRKLGDATVLNLIQEAYGDAVGLQRASEKAKKFLKEAKEAKEAG